jgi:hypothetical protein
MPRSSTCSTWVAIWSLRRFIDISDYVPLRPGKMHRWFRRSPWEFGGFGKLIWRQPFDSFVSGPDRLLIITPLTPSGIHHSAAMQRAKSKM